MKKFPQSPLFGKAQLNLGWCYWRDGQTARKPDRLPGRGGAPALLEDLATAYFRLADTQFQHTNYAGAITNYQTLIEKFAALPEAKTNLFERALYQTVRAGVAGGDLATATNALQQAAGPGIPGAWIPLAPCC